jgi:hypothetical protein
MIPAGVSGSCSAFLNTLNEDASFETCVEPLYNITSTFNPMTGLPADEVTSASITSTLTSLCATSNKCSDTLIRNYLGQFYTACQAELTSSGSDYSERIREMYDYLYIVNPFRSAVCTRNSASQRYCVLEIATQAAAVTSNSTGTPSNSTSAIKVNSLAALASGTAELVAQAAQNLAIYTPYTDLKKRFFPELGARAPTDAQATLMTPNATTYRTTSLPYLFLQADDSAKLLCAPCTKSVLASYIAWESQVPYALGLSSSPILGGQADLWNGIEAICGSNFTDAISQQAGVLATNGSAIATGAGERLTVGSGMISGALMVVVGSVMAGLI